MSQRRPSAAGEPRPTLTLSDKQLTAIRQAAQDDHASVIELTRQLVQTPSRSGEDSYEPIVRSLSAWLRDRGLTPHQLSDASGNLVGLAVDINGEHPGPRFVLDACIDTPSFGDEAAWTYPPTSATVADGWMHGRGVSDSKAAAAMFAHILARVQHDTSRLHGGLSLLLDADEHTGGFSGIKTYLADEHLREQIAGVMIGYPGPDHVVVGGRGFLRAELTVFGIAGHSGSTRPGGHNAVEKAVSLVDRITGDALPQPADDDDFGLGPKLTVTAIHGGPTNGGYSIVPDRCSIHVDIRLTPAFDAETASKLLANAAATIDATWPTPQPTSIRFEESWPPYQLGPDSPLATSLAAAAEQITGTRPRLKVAGPSNIGNYLASLGIEATAGYGVRYEGLHGTNERIDLSTIPQVQAAYHLAVMSLLRISP